MVVLRGDDDQSICLAHLGGKVGVLDGLSRIVGGQWKLCDIDEVGLDARALTQFPGYKASCVQAHTPHSGGTENHRDEQWTTCSHKPAPLLRPASMGRVKTAASAVPSPMPRQTSLSQHFGTR